jgi:DNA-binding XRE family transcriptional regulator
LTAQEKARTNEKGDACTMARPKRVIDTSVKKEMNSIASQWRRFRSANALSQKFLAEITGVSRRTIQSIESGAILPQQRTLDAFESLRVKYESEGKPTGKRKSKKTKEEGDF